MSLCFVQKHQPPIGLIRFHALTCESLPGSFVADLFLRICSHGMSSEPLKGVRQLEPFHSPPTALLSQADHLGLLGGHQHTLERNTQAGWETRPNAWQQVGRVYKPHLFRAPSHSRPYETRLVLALDDNSSPEGSSYTVFPTSNHRLLRPPSSGFILRAQRHKRKKGSSPSSTCLKRADSTVASATRGLPCKTAKTPVNIVRSQTLPSLIWGARFPRASGPSLLLALHLTIPHLTASLSLER